MKLRELDTADGYEAFYKAQRLNLLRYVRVQTNNGDQAEDIVQEVMIAIRKYWSTIEKPEFLMFQMARQELCRWAKRFIPSQFVPLEDFLQEADTAWVKGSPANVFEYVEEQDGLIYVLGFLPARQRETIILVDIVGLHPKAAGEIMGISVSSVKAHRSRAIEHLRELDLSHFGEMVN